MSKGNTFETNLLRLIFNGTTITSIANNATSSPITNIWVSLHTASPGESGNQSTSETNYGAYARVGVARTTAGWTVSGNSVSPAADITFPQATSGTATITHFAVGTAASGSNTILYYGTVTPNIAVSVGVTPRLTTATTITED